MTAKKAKTTPRKTSSPVRRSPRLAAEKEDEDDLEDTIISGVNFTNVRDKMREAAAGAVWEPVPLAAASYSFRVS